MCCQVTVTPTSGASHMIRTNEDKYPKNANSMGTPIINSLTWIAPLNTAPVPFFTYYYYDLFRT